MQPPVKVSQNATCSWKVSKSKHKQKHVAETRRKVSKSENNKMNKRHNKMNNKHVD
jgi:SUMO ligase MMS21 Smc5/6 complex component